jgi:hypothetical protein
MSDQLPVLDFEHLRATRQYLQDVAKVMGKLQQAFLPKSPHGWQYGLEVTMRGTCTQTFEVDGQPTRALLDLVRHKVRFNDRNWALRTTTPGELFNDIQSMIDIALDKPKFTDGSLEYDDEQATKYATALWWMERQFEELKNSLKQGIVSPILLYPHHFDLSLAWFPQGDERQLSIGFSTGDETIAEPYIYVTSYPDPKSIKKIELPPEAHWQTEGFVGIVMPYRTLQENTSPKKLLLLLEEAVFKNNNKMV